MFLLLFREQIKGPENASIARFDGLCCYQTSSETSDVFRAGSMAKTDSQTGFKKVRCGFNAGSMRAGARTGCFRESARTDLAGQSRRPEKTPKRRKRAKAQASATQPNPVLLQFQEQIKGPKNASIARFDGLGCYQSHSEISDVFRAGSAARTALRTGFKKVRFGFNAGSMQAGARTGCFRESARTDLAGQSRRPEKTPKRRKRAKAQASATQPNPVLLQFQEQIKGPKNASIARFDGLCCYQTSIETSDVFRAGSMAKTDSQTGFKKVRCGFNAGSMRARHALAAFGNQSAQTWRRSQKPEKHSNAANTRKRSPAQAPFASISGANKRPQKCLYRTV